jgi:rare lipoprotein A
MSRMRVGRLLVCILGGALLAGCFGGRRPESVAPRENIPPIAPPSVADMPDVVPKVEPRARSGNPPYYDVFGKRYYVLSSSIGYVERGVASWYGPGFDRVPTSTGETYDMYGMTAAHRTLPLPAYVQVTNLQNGRSVVVRVNDRGPFVGNRIIDLSYSAARKLDMLRNGTAMVEVRSIDPSLAAPGGAPLSPAAPQSVAPALQAATQTVTAAAAAGTTAPAAPPATTLPGGTATGSTQAAAPIAAPLFIQAGAFSDPANADRLVAKLHDPQYGKVFVRNDQIAGRKMYRVRIGPVRNVAEFDRIVAALDRAGVHDAHLALE